ncbi:MAG: HIT family protein [Anaerorhabdus sp.]
MCLFCKIINNELPCHKIYEDDYTLAFLDINPATFGHTLVVTKEHIARLEDASEDSLNHLTNTMLLVAKKIKNTCNPKGFNYLSNSDEISGQQIDHLHFHIIPRYDKNDGFEVKHTPQEIDLKEVLEKIKI